MNGYREWIGPGQICSAGGCDRECLSLTHVIPVCIGDAFSEDDFVGFPGFHDIY